jgi:hypothetical protein
MKRVLLGLCCIALLAGCDAAASYRDTIATSFGYITWAQAQYKASCVATPTASTCSLITRAIGLQNAAVDALDAYCNGAPLAGNKAWKDGGPCSPQKTLQGALTAALSALNPVIADLKLLATGKSSPKLTAKALKEEDVACVIAPRATLYRYSIQWTPLQPDHLSYWENMEATTVMTPEEGRK